LLYRQPLIIEEELLWPQQWACHQNGAAVEIVRTSAMTISILNLKIMNNTKNVKKCQKMSRNAKKCQEMPKFLKIYLFN
jgi:hypothetical protein